jgi:hypothetical protein
MHPHAHSAPGTGCSVHVSIDLYATQAVPYVLWRTLILHDCVQLLLGGVENSVVHQKTERVLERLNQNSGAHHNTTSPSLRHKLLQDCSSPNDTLQRLGEPHLPTPGSSSPPARRHALSTHSSPPSRDWQGNIRDTLPYFPDGLLPNPQCELAAVDGATSAVLDDDRVSAAGSISSSITYHW